MVRVHVYQPLPAMLGLGKTAKTVVLELPFEQDATLRTIFQKLAVQYPAFGSLSDPKPGDRLRSIMITIDGKLVTEPDHHKTPLHDGAEILLLPPYAGG
ncbi:MAG: MoaD/ThiS family protein [Dehalococcoidia bacterium]